MKTQDPLNAKQTSLREPRRGTARAQASKTKVRGSRCAGRSCTTFPVVEIGDAKNPQASGLRPGEAGDEIIPRLESACAELIAEQRSSTASWLELKQLIEPPEINHGELTSTRPSKAMNKENYTLIAIDIAKNSLEIRTTTQSRQATNDPAGLAKLITWLKGLHCPFVICEATGGYERPLLECLHQAGISVSLVNPSRVRAFALSEGIKSKTDPIDARMLLRFAQEKLLEPTPPPSASQQLLMALMDRRSHLTEQAAREKNRLQKSPKPIHSSIRKMLRFLEREIEALEKQIRLLIDENADLRSRSKTMQAVCGVGEVTAWTMLAFLPELTHLGRNQIVALAGIAPFNRDSGKTSGKRSIYAGRAKVRKCLDMAAQTAAQHNPVIAPYVRGLIARGKPYKCAMVAAMRKLLIHLHSLLKNPEILPCN